MPRGHTIFFQITKGENRKTGVPPRQDEPYILNHNNRWMFTQHVTPLLLLLFFRPPCPDGMRIVGQWCSTSCIEAKETLDSVPYLINFATFYFLFHFTSSGVFLSSPPLLLSPLLFRHHKCRLPRPCWFNSLMVPPPHPDSPPRSPLRPLTQV